MSAFLSLLLLLGPSVLAAEGDAPPPLPDWRAGSPLPEGEAPEEVSDYVALAIVTNPEVRVAWARWQEATHAVARARALPDPTLSFGIFVLSVETRVGPQRGRIGVQQVIPWPTALTAGGDAASERARAAQANLEAVTLAVSQEVEVAFWDLWEVRTARAIHEDHLRVVDGLSDTLRARLEVGAASLADLQQVDLSRARLEDAIRSMGAREQVAKARLRTAVGVRGELALPTEVPSSSVREVGEAEAALVEAALAHPRLVAATARVEAGESVVRQAEAQRMPGLMVGADWMITGPAVDGGMGVPPDSGKDAVALGVGLRLPIWQRAYGEEIRRAEAALEASSASRVALADRAVSDVFTWVTRVSDSARRAAVTDGTLLPQAEAAYQSLLGSYTAGQGSVAQVLLAQRDLLELRVRAVQARADHARAWASLETTCGRPVVGRPVDDDAKEAP